MNFSEGSERHLLLDLTESVVAKAQYVGFLNAGLRICKRSIQPGSVNQQFEDTIFLSSHSIRGQAADQNNL